MFKLTNEFHIKDILDLLAAIGGLIIGQKLHHTVRVSITSLLGAIQIVTGCFICFKGWPIDPKDYGLYYLQIALVVIFTVMGCWYQRQ